MKNPVTDKLLKAILKSIKPVPGKARIEFLKDYYHRISGQDCADKDVTFFYQAAMFHYKLAQKRRKDQVLISINNLTLDGLAGQDGAPIVIRGTLDEDGGRLSHIIGQSSGSNVIDIISSSYVELRDFELSFVDGVANNSVDLIKFAGMGEASAMTAGGVMIGQEAPEKSRGAVLGTYSLMGAAGIMVLTFIGGLLFDQVGKSAPFTMMGCINLVILIVAFVMRRSAIRETKMQESVKDVQSG